VKHATLGTSSVEVSEMGLGLWGIGGGDTWGDQESEQAIETIHTAVDNGITFLDTAEKYGDGQSERLLGRALEGLDRSELTIATKAAEENLRPDDLKAACQRSLDRLNTDYVDIYYVHWPNPDVPLRETMTAMRELQDDGMIRAIACSNFGEGYLREALEHASIAANQIPYNLLWRTIEEGLMDACTSNGVGVVGYSTLCMGLLTGKFELPDDVPEGRARTRHFSGDRPQARHGEPGAERETFEAIDRIRTIADDAGVEMTQLAVAWVLSRPGVTSALVGARSPEQVRENVGAVDLDASEATYERLTAATEDLKNSLGSNHDMYQAESRYSR
jgi:aryl-alcohol dehydrogenase-like predicted oxidoreductase